MDSVPSVIKDFEYNYDEVGNLESVSDGDSTYTMEYNKVHQLKSITNDGSTDMQLSTLDYTYNANGALESAEDNVGNLRDYQYYELSRVKEIDMTIDGQTVTPTVELDYDEVGNLKSISRSGGAKTATIDTAYEYDEVNRLKSIDHMADTVSLASYDYEWDEAYRLTEEISVDGTEEYEYDDTNQINVASAPF